MPDALTPSPADQADDSDQKIWNELEAAEAAEPKGPAAEEAEPVQEAEDKPKDTPALAAEADAGKSKTETPEDVWANAPPALKTAYEQAKADAEKAIETERKRQSGTVRALTLKTQAQETEIATLRSKVAPGKPATASKEGTSEEPAETVDSLFKADPKLKQFAEEYPEVAEAMASVVNTKLAGVDTRVGRLEARSAAVDDLTQSEILLSEHPDYEEAVTSPEFRTWYENAPSYVRRGVERNGKGIIDGQEVADLTQRFKDQTGWVSKTPPAAKAAPQTAAPSKSETDPKRRVQLASASSPRGTTTAPPVADGPPPDDAPPEVLWAYWEKQDQKKAAASR